MKILLINVDNRWNLAIRRMYNYFRKDHEVEMRDLKLSGYPHKRHITIDASGFDQVYVSNIFEINKDRVTVLNCDDVRYGGVGSREPDRKLPPEIEATEPYYFPDEDTSYGFLTRGCIRKCHFCKVPTHEGALREYSDPAEICKHKRVKFMDNNFLAYPGHMEILRWLNDHREIKCEFNQGLDFRLVNDENLAELAKLNYMKPYTFAFDDSRYKPALEKKLKLIKKHIPQPWAVRFYVYFHPNMGLVDLIGRVEWCRKNECLPYVMRDSACWDSPLRDFLIDFAAYCNQPSFFKTMTFPQFLQKRVEGRSIKEERREENTLFYLVASAVVKI